MGYMSDWVSYDKDKQNLSVLLCGLKSVMRSDQKQLREK